MKPSKLHDPNNPTPEVAPGDAWGDGEAVPIIELPAQTVIPARRSVAKQPSTPGYSDVGLRIESNIGRSPQKDSNQRIEVQEVNRSVVRLVQEEKAPERFERQFTFHEKKIPADPGVGHQEGDREWAGTQHLSKRWILGMTAAVVLIVIAGLMLLPWINSWNAPHVNSNRSVLTIVEEEKIAGMEAMNVLLERQPEALQIFRTYAQAAHSDDVIPLIVDGRSIRETLRIHWRPLDVPKDWAPDVESDWSVLEFDGKAYGVLEGRFSNQSQFSAYFFFQDDRLLLDWKATTVFRTASFSQLSKGLGEDTSEIRGVLSSDEFYSAAWPEEDYQSYRLTMPREESTVWCYARRGTPAHLALVPLFSSGELTGEEQIERKVTISLARGPVEALPNQWLINDLLHIDWGTH